MKLTQKNEGSESIRRKPTEVELYKMAIKALLENINAMTAVEVRQAQKLATNTIFALRDRIKELE